MQIVSSQSRPLSDLELSAFCNQMALILRAGISAAEGISVLREDAPTDEEKKILDDVAQTFTQTGSLSQGLEHTGLYPPYMLHMVKIGEETGTLDDVMASLARHYEREDAVRRSITGALTYPMIMIAMMAAVIVVLLVKVMPVFNQVFVQLGSELTGFSRALLDLGAGIERYAALLIILLAVLAGAVLYGVKTNQGRATMRRLGYRIPFTRTVYHEIAACRFAGGMALTLSSGLNPDMGMELVQALNEDPFFAQKLDACRKATEEGKSLAEALHTSGVFTGLYARMASVGEKTGAMEKAMEQIAARYQDDIDTRMNQTLSVLEPTLVVGLSLIAGVILLSIMLPLMGIMSGI